MKTFLYALAALFSSSAHYATAADTVANFTGHWVATEGKVSSQLPGMSGSCSHLELVIEQTETQVGTKLYDATCNLFSSKWGPISQEIRAGKIYEGNTEVGTIDATTMITIAQDGSVAYAYNLRLGSDAQGTYLDSYYGTKNGIGAIVIEARLRKEP